MGKAADDLLKKQQEEEEKRMERMDDAEVIVAGEGSRTLWDRATGGGTPRQRASDAILKRRREQKK